MSIPDAANWQHDQPLDGATDTPVDSVDVDTPFSASIWDAGDGSDAFADPAGTNLFSAEIENVDPSDWDDSTFHIWDDGDAAAVHDVGDVGAIDFSL